MQNLVDIRAYRAVLENNDLPGRRWLPVDAEDRFRAEIIERLMCDLSVDLDVLCRRHGRFSSELTEALQQIDTLAAEGLARRDGLTVSVPEDKRPLLRLAASAFDAHLPAEAERAVRHAVAV